MVPVTLGDAHASGAIGISIDPSITAIQIAPVLSALYRFFASQQFRSIDFDKGEMMVEHRGRADEITFATANEGNMCEDGIVEFAYNVPHK